MDLASYMLTKKESIRGLTVYDRELDVSESEHFIVVVVDSRRGQDLLSLQPAGEKGVERP